MRRSHHQRGSFAVEAAFVCLTIVCLGLAFYFEGGQLQGSTGTCSYAANINENTPNDDTDDTVSGISISSTGGSGLLGVIGLIKCKAEVLTTDNEDVPPGLQQWLFEFEAINAGFPPGST